MAVWPNHAHQIGTWRCTETTFPGWHFSEATWLPCNGTISLVRSLKRQLLRVFTTLLSLKWLRAPQVPWSQDVRASLYQSSSTTSNHQGIRYPTWPIADTGPLKFGTRLAPVAKLKRPGASSPRTKCKSFCQASNARCEGIRIFAESSLPQAISAAHLWGAERKHPSRTAKSENGRWKQGMWLLARLFWFSAQPTAHPSLPFHDGISCPSFQELLNHGGVAKFHGDFNELSSFGCNLTFLPLNQAPRAVHINHGAPITSAVWRFLSQLEMNQDTKMIQDDPRWSKMIHLGPQRPWTNLGPSESVRAITADQVREVSSPEDPAMDDLKSSWHHEMFQQVLHSIWIPVISSKCS